MFKTIKRYDDFINENIKDKELLKNKVLYHLIGGNIIDSIENIKLFNSYFNGNIPKELKYEGVAYRIFQTKSKQLYDRVLKHGFNSLDSQKYYSCSKTLNGIENVKQKTVNRKYKYYVVFKFNVTFDDVLFDVNKLINYIGLDENRFKNEKEILVISDKMPSLNKECIIEHVLL